MELPTIPNELTLLATRLLVRKTWPYEVEKDERFAVETKFRRLAVDTRFKRFGVDTRLLRDADETYPAVPRPITVDWRFGRTTGCCPFNDETRKLLTVV
jgi:hypothetical protein